MELPSIVVGGNAAAVLQTDYSSPLSSPPSSSLFIDFVDDIAPCSLSPVPSSPPSVLNHSHRLQPSPPVSTAAPASCQDGGSQLGSAREASELPADPKPMIEPSTPIRSKNFTSSAEDGTTPPSPSRAGQPRKVAAQRDGERIELSTPQVTITRSGRRVVQKRSVSDAIDSKSSKASPSEPAAIKRRKREASKWQTDFVLSSAKSPLGNHDIRVSLAAEYENYDRGQEVNVLPKALLCNPEAWEVLSKEEQREVLSLFPSSQHIVDPDTDNARPDVSSLKNDDNFRHDCARYQTDLQGGFHDKAWLAEAFEAHELRKNGFFDRYIIEAFESGWEIQLPDEYKPDYMRASIGNDTEAQQSNNGEQQEQGTSEAATSTDKNCNGKAKESKPDRIRYGATKVGIGIENKTNGGDETDAKVTIGNNHTPDNEDTKGKNENMALERALGPDVRGSEQKSGESLAKSDTKEEKLAGLYSMEENGD